MGGACGGYAPQRSAAGDHASAAMERGFGKLMRVASVVELVLAFIFEGDLQLGAVGRHFAALDHEV